jgi:hypothetical protein
MTGRTCLKHGVPEWCPEGICRWCPEPDPGPLVDWVPYVPIIPVPAMTMWPLLPSPTACPHNKGWYDSNATYTYSCNACGKVWPMATGPRYTTHLSTCLHIQNSALACTCGATP